MDDETLEEILDAPALPADAGEYADGLSAILFRIPKGWGRWIQVGPGWYPLITKLNTDLAALDPEYTVHQVKEKFGSLRYYAEPSRTLPACCDAVSEEDWEAHSETPEHNDAAKKIDTIQDEMDRLISVAEAESYNICEISGGPGIMMVSGGYYRTLDPTAPFSKGFKVVISEPSEDWEYYQTHPAHLMHHAKALAAYNATQAKLIAKFRGE